MKLIKLNDVGMCMSVSCDFYQTCIHNSVSMNYKTKRKFYPKITDLVNCHSSKSGKRSELRDNNYPHIFESIQEA
jgi:hypothetical protein